MTEKLEPALTADEWRAALENVFVRDAMLAESCDPVRGNDHRRAALTLYGRPFGFTAEEVAAMETVYQFALTAPTIPSAVCDAIERHYALAAKIAALLPPEVR